MFSKYLKHFNYAFYKTRRSLKSYSVTKNEMKLFECVNAFHSDGTDEGKLFDTDDKCIVRLDDVREFYKFMKTCYGKMVNKTCDPDDNFGYFKINSSNVVPYYINDGKKYVPIMFFERDLRDTLGPFIVKARGWHLAQLKFLFEVIGIEKNLYTGDSLEVISVDMLKPYLERQPHLAEFWPHDSVCMKNIFSSDDQCYSSSSRTNTPFGFVNNTKNNAIILKVSRSW